MNQRESILRYLNDDEYYNLKSKEVIADRKYTKYFCLRHNGVPVAQKK